MDQRTFTYELGIPLGADPPRGFELHELLQDRGNRLADHVDTVAGAERLERLGQGRLGQGHRWFSFSA